MDSQAPVQAPVDPNMPSTLIRKPAEVTVTVDGNQYPIQKDENGLEYITIDSVNYDLNTDETGRFIMMDGSKPVSGGRRSRRRRTKRSKSRRSRRV